MKKALLATLSLFMMIQPIQAAELVAQPAPSKTQQMLAWFKSLKEPTQKNIQVVKDFLNSKWQCLRHGTNCSKAERASLAALSAMVATAAAAVVIVPTGKFIKRKRDERLVRERTKELQEVYQKFLDKTGDPWIKEATIDRLILVGAIEKENAGQFFQEIYNGKKVWDLEDMELVKNKFEGSLHNGFSWFSVIINSPSFSVEEKKEAIKFLTQQIVVNPTPKDILQFRLFDWEQREVPLKKMEKFQERGTESERYYPELLPQDLTGLLRTYVVPQAVISIPEDIQKALNQRSEMRAMMFLTAMQVAQKKDMSQWFDSNVDDPSQFKVRAKEKLVNIITLIYQSDPQQPLDYVKAIKEFPELEKLNIKGKLRNYDYKDIVLASPFISEEVQKTVAEELKRSPNADSNLLLKLYEWEKEQMGQQ